MRRKIKEGHDGNNDKNDLLREKRNKINCDG